jgi:putative transposase
MPNHDSDPTTIAAVLEHLNKNGFDGLATAFEMLFNEAMLLERSAYLGAGPWERTDTRTGYANGFKPKRMKTRLGELELRVPKVRDVPEGVEPYYPSALERGERSEQALKLAVAEMYVKGVSTRKVRDITKQLCGLDISADQVSRVAKELDGYLSEWRERPIGSIRYLVLDATYLKVRQNGSVVDSSVLIAAGVRADGKRSILGCSVSLSEAEVHWRGFLESLAQRGMHGVELITSDDVRAVLPSVKWQRCQFHLQQNATHYVPRIDMRAGVAREIRAIFNAPDRTEAERLLAKAVERHRNDAPKLAEWMEANIPEGLNVFALPDAHRRRLRTSNMLERLNRELKRRTRVATLFPNEASALRLVTAVLAEISEEWETGRLYLTMEPI